MDILLIITKVGKIFIYKLRNLTVDSFVNETRVNVRIYTLIITNKAL